MEELWFQVCSLGGVEYVFPHTMLSRDNSPNLRSLFLISFTDVYVSVFESTEPVSRSVSCCLLVACCRDRWVFPVRAVLAPLRGAFTPFVSLLDRNRRNIPVPTVPWANIPVCPSRLPHSVQRCGCPTGEHPSASISNYCVACFY